jgi:glycosyltransferase involved in cell wall biosynthesis
MVKRNQISLIYDYDVNWIGGTYYILNIIKAINFLPDYEKPFITIYHDYTSVLDDIKAINYPYMKYVGFKYNLSKSARIINNLSLLLGGKEIVTAKLPGKKVDNFYYRPFTISDANIGKYFCWIADLQDLCLPEFFKKPELKFRIAKYNRMVNEKVPIVFSSNAALNDFKKFFPHNVNEKKVVRFVSISAPKFESLSIEDLRAKFKINGDYIITSNQFWKHKNHKVVIEAFKTISLKYPGLQLVLTGKEHDYRNLSYADSLKDYVAENNLTERVLFLGFIDRDEQLKLMSESITIIQPSLFEGWSTVVEDAKFLKKCIICSDIPVHREQLPGSTLFFEPTEANDLKEKIEAVLSGVTSVDMSYSHDKTVLDFGRAFLNIFN